MRSGGILLFTALVLSACGTESSGAKLDRLPDTFPTSITVVVSDELCGSFDAGPPSPEWFDALPERDREWAQAAFDLEQFAVDALAGDGEDSSATTSSGPPSIPDALVESLTHMWAPSSYETLAETLEAQCGPGPLVDGFRSLAVVTAMVQPAEYEDYCPLLSEFIVSGIEGATSGQIEGLLSEAPPHHVPALKVVGSSVGVTSPQSTGDVPTLREALLGIGLYAETRCGIGGAYILAAVQLAMSELVSG